MKIFRTKNVKIPSRGTPFSAGIDFFVPEFDQNFINDFLSKNPGLAIQLDNNLFELGPNERALIPSGIKIRIPERHAMIAFNKSGVSTKTGLSVLACVIDEDYQGEVHLSVVNTSRHVVAIQAGQKLVQFLVIPLFYEHIWESKSVEDLFDTRTLRGSDGFGSTDK